MKLKLYEGRGLELNDDESTNSGTLSGIRANSKNNSTQSSEVNPNGTQVTAGSGRDDNMSKAYARGLLPKGYMTRQPTSTEWKSGVMTEAGLVSLCGYDKGIGMYTGLFVQTTQTITKNGTTEQVTEWAIPAGYSQRKRNVAGRLFDKLRGSHSDIIDNATDILLSSLGKYKTPGEFYMSHRLDNSDMSESVKSTILSIGLDQQVIIAAKNGDFVEVGYKYLSPDEKLAFAQQMQREAQARQSDSYLKDSIRNVTSYKNYYEIVKAGRIDLILKDLNDLTASEATDIVWRGTEGDRASGEGSPFRAGYTSQHIIAPPNRTIQKQSGNAKKTESLAVTGGTYLLYEDITNSTGVTSLKPDNDGDEVKQPELGPELPSQKSPGRIKQALRKITDKVTADYTSIKPDLDNKFGTSSLFEDPEHPGRLIRVDTSDNWQVGNYIYNALTSEIKGSGSEVNVLREKYLHFMDWVNKFGYGNISPENTFVRIVNSLIWYRRESTRDNIKDWYDLYARKVITVDNVKQVCEGIIFEHGVDEKGSPYGGIYEEFMSLSFNSKLKVLVKSFKGYDLYAQRKFLRNFISYCRDQDDVTQAEMAELIIASLTPSAKASVSKFMGKAKKISPEDIFSKLEEHQPEEEPQVDLASAIREESGA